MNYLDIALDSLIDSAKIFALALVIYILLSFFEGKIASLLDRKKRFAPLFGSVAGIIPQCGISVVSSDLFLKGHITMGTLIAIFLACSDEALPVLFSDFTGKWYMAFALIGVKLVGAFVFGSVVDLINRKGDAKVDSHLEHCEGERHEHIGCCHHDIEGQDESPWHEHLFHPLVHSVKIFAYSFVISFLFSCLVEIWVGEANLTGFLQANYYLSPLLSALIGLIPSCASSVLISDLYLLGGIPFGALVAGLAVNAGLGPLYLFKDKGKRKEAFLIYGLCLVFALILGYSFMWVGI